MIYKGRIPYIIYNFRIMCVIRVVYLLLVVINSHLILRSVMTLLWCWVWYVVMLVMLVWLSWNQRHRVDWGLVLYKVSFKISKWKVKNFHEKFIVLRGYQPYKPSLDAWHVILHSETIFSYTLLWIRLNGL